GFDGKSNTLTLPVVKSLKVSGKPRPMVYLPVQLSPEITQNWLVYLTDRSRRSTQLRVGTDTVTQHLVIDTDAENLFPSQRTYSVALKNNPLVVSGEESVNLDGIELRAEASFSVKTPMLKVESFELQEGKPDKVVYYLTNAEGKTERLVKPVVKKLRVGDSVRPVVEGVFDFGDAIEQHPFALEVLDDNEPQPYFVIGRKTVPGGVILNLRTSNLLERLPLFTAGHIEKAQVAGMTFPVKLDTGADVSSLNALDIKRFEQDGKPMVTFTYKNRTGDERRFTREVVDEMRVRAREGEKATARPVVQMQVKLGELERTIRVNLLDRSRFEYSMILGKNFLRHGVLVSSDQDYLLSD
ncbi:ATP-dependent zinc protease family protein, partial [Vibrio sp.]|uniref:ATP-dependent zinc protease family protein n=1 Tax=Vibrio sp. TaxID=678 RepID=UPI003D148173